MVWMARLAKARQIWAAVSTVVTLVIIPLVRWLWKRHQKSKGKGRKVIDVTAKEVNKDK